MTPRLSPSSRAPRQADLSGVERELARMAREHTHGEPGWVAPVIRTCSLNLVTVVGDRRRAAAASRVMSTVSRRHPARVVIIHYQPRSATPELSSRVSGHCRLTATGQRQICCEQIDLIARGHLTEHLESALASLMAADLPVYLWWNSPLPPRDDLLERLSKQADVLITALGEAGDGAAALEWLASFHRRFPDRPALADLLWLELLDWRRHIALAFNVRARQLSWERIDGIVIGHAAPYPPAAALLLGGWLSSRLGWSPRKAGGSGPRLVWELSAGGRPATVIFSPSSKPGRHGDIASVAFRAGAGRSKTVTLGGERRLLCGSGGRPLARAVPSAWHLPTEELLCRAIGGAGSDPSFVSSVEQCAALIRGARERTI